MKSKNFMEDKAKRNFFNSSQAKTSNKVTIGEEGMSIQETRTILDKSRRGIFNETENGAERKNIYKNENIIEEQKDKDKSKFKFFYALSMGTQLGLVISGSLVVFLLLGIYIDKKLNSSPLFLLIFVFVSFIMLFFELRYYLFPFLKRHK